MGGRRLRSGRFMRTRDLRVRQLNDRENDDDQHGRADDKAGQSGAKVRTVLRLSGHVEVSGLKFDLRV